MRRASKENSIVICTIVLCFMVTIGLCSVFAGDGIIGVFSLSKKEETSTYAIAIGGYSDMSLARATADLIKNRGGAGYVTATDETVEIIYAVYPDEDTAKKVLSGLGENGAYVKKLPISTPKYKVDGVIKNAIDDALKYYDVAFDSLYKISNSLADLSIGLDDARAQIKVLYGQIVDIKSAFYSKTAETDSNEATDIKLALITCLALLDNINTSGTTAQFASSIRYALVQLVLCRMAL